MVKLQGGGSITVELPAGYRPKIYPDSNETCFVNRRDNQFNFIVEPATPTETESWRNFHEGGLVSTDIPGYNVQHAFVRRGHKHSGMSLGRDLLSFGDARITPPHGQGYLAEITFFSTKDHKANRNTFDQVWRKFAQQHPGN